MILSICLPIINRPYLDIGPSALETRPIIESLLRRFVRIGYEDGRNRSNNYKEKPGCRDCDTIGALNSDSHINTRYIGLCNNGMRWPWVRDEFRTSNINHCTENEQVECKAGRDSNNPNIHKYLSHNNVIKNTKLINDAKIIYLCGKSIRSMPEHTRWIVSKVEKQKIIFNISEAYLIAYADKLLVIDIIKKSNVIIGHESDLKVLRNHFFAGQYTSLNDMIDRQLQDGKIILLIQGRNNVSWAFNGKKGSQMIHHNAEGFYKNNHICDYILAGFLREYYKESLSVEDCIKSACKWAEEQDKIYNNGSKYQTCVIN